MFTENTLTEAHRESLEWLADSLDEQLREGLATARGIERDRIGDLIDGGPYAADEALEAKLVDRLSYQDEVIEQAHDLAGEGAEMVGLEAYAAAAGPSGEPAATIALIRGVGQIQEGESDRGPGGWVMGGDSTAKALADAIDDPEVEAILFRIDSGGGSAVASETIGRQVRRARDTGKPVIVSMGNAAASGGYWIAMDAASIVADPGTLTGSIGVLAGKPVLTELWHWLGVNWGHVQRGANADIWSTTQDFDAAGRERLENFLDRTYDAFTAGVARGRGMSQAEVEAIAEGRVWTGAQAKELGLVDELGGFSRALQIARETAGVGPEEPIELRPFPRPRGPLEEALDLLGDPPLIGAETRFGWDRIRGWLDAVQPGILRMPPIIVR
jgi:protease-4